MSYHAASVFRKHFCGVHKVDAGQGTESEERMIKLHDFIEKCLTDDSPDFIDHYDTLKVRIDCIYNVVLCDENCE